MIYLCKHVAASMDVERCGNSLERHGAVRRNEANKEL